MKFVKRLLEHPLTRGLSIDDPRTTELRRQIIQDKPFLKKLYLEWYSMLHAAVPAGDGAILELGSGGGFLQDVFPEVVTSEVFYCPGCSLSLDARNIPFADNSLKAIVMIDVFHHIPDVRRFLAEASRCLRPGGVLAMIEPWVTPWSRFVYSRLHHEPFEPNSLSWQLPLSGPLSGANSALPWIVFERDKSAFLSEFQSLTFAHDPSIDYPFSYLLSGGVSMRNFLPGFFMILSGFSKKY